MNPFDHKEENRKKLPAFIEINEMNYPTVFVDKKVTTAFNVYGYPTFYLIDQEGEIIFSEMGYSEENAAKIDSLLELVL